MAKAIMVQGTTSNAGKSLLTAALCRIFKEDGHRVAPFKAQNMALNSYITADGFEMGRAQVMQAEAAGVQPDVRMNPILLKPTSDVGSQVIVNGVSRGNKTARDYYAYKSALRGEVAAAYESLAADYDIIVIEGAGSPAEINLKQEDLVNMGMAKMAKAPVLICGDIDRGGVFAALAGTMLLLDDTEKPLVKGFLINKFRGDESILAPGLTMLEELTGVKTLGVVPYLRVDIDDEDSLTDRFTQQKTDWAIDIAVIRLPRISNFTDFHALEYTKGVNLRYVATPGELGKPDLVILPGTKNTMGDLAWLRQSGLEAMILKFAHGGGAVFGICGGFQMLGESISDPLSTEHGGNIPGLCLLPITTLFYETKTTTQKKGQLDPVDGIFSALSGADYVGYEIHMGQSTTEKNLLNKGNVYGSYLHGIFDRESALAPILSALLKEKGLDETALSPVDMAAYKESQYALLAAGVRSALDMKAIYRILEEGV